MSFHIECPHCGKGIGVMNLSSGEYPQRLIGLLVKELQNRVLDCNHPEPTETKTKHLFGLIEQTLVVYHETDTWSLSLDYLGPPSKLLLWVALLFCGSDGISVNGEPAWWDFKTGFFGPGVDQLTKLRTPV